MGNEQPMLQVTTITDLKNYKGGAVVKLPDFAEGQPFNARLRRPSIMSLIKHKKIPNELINKAQELFAESGVEKFTKDDSALNDVFEVLDIICDAAFIEPTYQELKDNGIELTDEQFMAVFNYAQEGMAALSSFRTE